MVRTIWIQISNALRDFSKNAKWHAEEWATNLSTLLQDEALGCIHVYPLKIQMTMSNYGMHF